MHRNSSQQTSTHYRADTTSPLRGPRKSGGGDGTPPAAVTTKVVHDIRADPRRTLRPGRTTSDQRVGDHRAHHRPPPIRLDRTGLPCSGHRTRSRRRGRAELRQWSPGHRDEPRPAGLYALPAHHAARPVRSDVGGTGPLHPVLRAHLTHPVHPAVPRRVRPRTRGSQGAAYLGLEDPRPPRVAAHRRGGDHHRPARTGTGLRGRYGDGGALRARAVRPGHPRGQEPVRPLHLRDRLRRRHPGGRHGRGGLARGNTATRQPHRDLRRQRDLDRGRHPNRVQRGRRGPLRGLRVARPDGERRRGRGSDRGGDRRRTSRHGQAVDHRPPHDHRLPGAERDEHRRGARCRAGPGRGRCRQGGPRDGRHRAVHRRGRGDRPHPCGPRPRRPRPRAVERHVPRLGGSQPGAQGAVRPPLLGPAPRGVGRRPADLGGRPQGRRDP